MKPYRKVLIFICVICCTMAMTLTAAAAEKASIKLNKTKITLYVGETAVIKAEVSGESSRVVWKSSNKKVAVVKNGTIVAKKSGKTTITAKANGKTKKCIVTVKKTPAYVKAYKKLLSQSKIGEREWPASECSFALAYIDGNSVPELVIQSWWSGTANGYYEIYTCKNGKTQRIDVNTGVSFEYYKKKGIIKGSYFYTVPQGGPGTSTTHYRIKNGKVSERLSKCVWEPCESYNREKTEYDYTLNYKNINKSKYNTQLKKMVGNKKAAVPVFYKNTKANREEFVK